MRVTSVLYVGLCGLCLWIVPGLALAMSAPPPASPVPAAAPPAVPDDLPPAPAEQTVEALTKAALKSIVVITITGRDGKQQGLGSGFIISADGLIATNLHVIGEARPISVQLADGKQVPVTAIHATHNSADLAIVQVDARDLPVLLLGDSDQLQQGQQVIALGNPRGLKHSVVSGIVSGTREIDGRPMIQLAMPIEAGNSGGPLLDLQGRVHGIITMKSLVTPNLGFAMAINLLKPLLKTPNPVPMERWLTIGTLDPKEWTPLFGARWRQRSGKISVSGQGGGFGGRSICLSEQAVPELPYEIGVKVKLGNEEGAAGIVFHADGQDKHFGFYPSGGSLRLSRFDGPDVFSWQVLVDKPSPAYRRGDWNMLKVRLEKDRILCYVNEQLAIEFQNTVLPTGKVGLAKFRETEAEFKRFQIGQEVRDDQPSPEVAAAIEKLVTDIAPVGPLQPSLVADLVPQSGASLTVLRERAKRLEQQAAQLRLLALVVHQKTVRDELAKLMQGPEADVDLLKAALLIARLDNDELDVDSYLKQVEQMAREILASLPEGADEPARLAALNKHLFQENGFHGSRADYYNRSNSYLNDVLDDREGLPITLSVLYMEIARRLNLKIVGIGLPGHFVVQFVPATGDPQIIDVYDRGTPLTREAAEKKVLELSGRPAQAEHFQPMTKGAILSRMLQNLMGLARDAEDPAGMLRYVETMVALAPDSGSDRWYRAILRFQTGQKEGAQEDVEWLIQHSPEGIDLDRVRELGRLLERQP